MRKPKIEELLEAILHDDRATVQDLLTKDPMLAAARTSEAKLYDHEIFHWIYAGDTALHLAAAGYRYQIIEMFLSAGADCNTAGLHRLGRPLHYAADGYITGPTWNSDHQVKTIEGLLAAGANINAQDKNGATALHRAVRTRCASAVRVLLAAGANPILKNKPGSTAFHLAVQNTGRGGSGKEEARVAQRQIIEEFLRRGVSPLTRDCNGKSVLDWVKSSWIQAIFEGKSRT